MNQDAQTTGQAKSGPAALSRRRLMQLASIASAAPLMAASAHAHSEPAATPAPSAPKAPSLSSPQREWASKHLRGLANLFLPSFQPDLETPDEDGLRPDVRHAIDLGFCGTMPMVNWTPPGNPQWEIYYRTLIEESAGRLPIHGIMFTNKAEQDVALLRQQEEYGVDAVLLAARYRPDISADELYDEMRKRIEATELPVILYAALNEGRAFPHLGPAGQPLEVYDRIADLPNVVALKVSQPISLTSTMQLCDAVADRLLVAPVNLDFVPLLARHYHMQWSGQWNGEAVQTPTNQLGNQLLAATAAGDVETANEAAIAIQPVHDAFFQLQSEVIRAGAHPWQHNKYYSWLGGGNGGLLLPPASEADHVPVLTPAARAEIRAAFEASGLTPTDAPEESFVTGRAAYERGVRMSDLKQVPRYEA